MSTRYRIPATVKSVEFVKEVVSGRMVAGEAKLEEVERGWFVCFEGSWERLYFGKDKPDLAPGQLVDIIVEPR